MDHVSQEHENTRHIPPKIHPLMPPEERRALWRRVQALWKQPVAEVIAELEKSREEWDHEPPPSH